MKNLIDLNIYKRKLKQDSLKSGNVFNLIKKLCKKMLGTIKQKSSWD